MTLGILLVACAPKPVYHTVKFDSNGGTAMQSVAIESGLCLSEPKDPEWVGYTFLGWYYGDSLWDFANTPVTADLTLKAKWERIKYTVSFDTDGGTVLEGYKVGLGDCADTPKNPTKDGYLFKGWYLGDEEWNFERMAVMSDITLKARWERITYKVTFDANGGNKTEPVTVAHGDLLPMPIKPTKQNHRFLGWYFGDMPWDFETNKVTSAITLMAKWASTIMTHEVSFMIDDTLHTIQHVESGKTAALPEQPTKQGHRFLGWYFGDTPWDFENGIVTAPVTLTAKWEPVPTHEVKFTVDGTPHATQHVVDGEKATLPTPPTKENHRFIGWYLGEALWNFEVNTVTEPITLTAKWEAIVTHEVTFMVDGTVTDTQHIVSGEKATAPVSPTKENHRFLGWYLGETAWNFATDTVTEPITLTAKWESGIVTYTVKFMYSENKLYDTRYVESGDLLEVPIAPTSETQIFLDWYFGDVLWDFENNTVTSDITLTAKWRDRKRFTITFNTDGGTPIAVMYVLEGNLIIEPNTTKDRHSLESWQYNGEVWDFSVPPTCDMELVADWAVDLPIHVLG